MKMPMNVSPEIAAYIKALLWEGDGFLLLYKRLDMEDFSGRETKRRQSK